MFDFAGNGDNQSRQKDRRSCEFFGCYNKEIFFGIGDAEESGKKRIAEGLSCCVVHMMGAQRRAGVSIQKSKCLV